MKNDTIINKNVVKRKKENVALYIFTLIPHPILCRGLYKKRNRAEKFAQRGNFEAHGLRGVYYAVI